MHLSKCEILFLAIFSFYPDSDNQTSDAVDDVDINENNKGKGLPFS